MDDHSQVFEQESLNEPPHYVRGYCKDTEKLSNLLKEAYHCHGSFILPSGMAAIATGIQVSLEQQRLAAQKAWEKAPPAKDDRKIVFLYANELYSDTPKNIESWASISPIPVELVPIDARDGLAFDAQCNALKNRFVILFVESCSNPSSHIFDFSRVKRLKDLCRRAIVIVDNTWLTHLVFNPFDYQVDFVVTSLSKYYSAGHKIGGALMVNSTFTGHSMAFMKRCGYHVSPQDAALLLSQYDALLPHLTASSDLTKALLEHTKTHYPKLQVEHVLTRQEARDRADKFWAKKEDGSLRFVPSVFSFWLHVDKKVAYKVMQGSELPFETSFGGAKSKLDNWPSERSPGLTLCRFAVGYEETLEEVLPRWVSFLESVKNYFESHK